MSHISASQISLLSECPRKWLFKYILKFQEPKNENLYLGTHFHSAVDNPEALETMSLEGLNEAEYPYRAILRKMVKSAKQETARLPPVFVKEHKINIVENGTQLIGYLDGVRKSDDGKWYICERKTSGRIDETKKELLHNETQVTAYIGGVYHIGKELGLDYAKFQGLTYEVTEKPQERYGKKDTHASFVEKAECRTVIWTVPATLAQHCRKTFLTNLNWAVETRDKITKEYGATKDIFAVPGNTNSCMKWGGKCPFFENCHGNHALGVL